MAVEYSLLTWAGLGTTVTFTDAGDIVNFTAHGAPNGHAFRFTTTGALPTGLTAGTTYYLGAGADANKFLVYPTANDAINGTNQVTFSGTGSGTNKVVGEYWSALDATGRARYGTAGSERVYATLATSVTAINAATSDYNKDIYLEVRDKFTDNTSANFSNKWKSLTIASRVNGVRTPAFHQGTVGGGYVSTITNTASNNILSANASTTYDGLEFRNPSTGNYGALRCSGPKAVVVNNILTGGYGYQDSGQVSYIANNIALNCPVAGFFLIAYAGAGSLCFGNLAVGCGIGFSGANSYVSCVGNIAIGNTTNWGTAPTTCYMDSNIGVTGDTVWGTNALTTGTTGMFRNYAGNDFYPASASAVQVELITLSTGDGLPRYDIVDAVRPNYINASTDKADAGPFEFDHGNGLAPSTVPISITGMANGSEFAIYKTSDMSEIAAPQSTTGSYSASYTYTADVGITVRVRKGSAATKYLPYEYQGTITSTGFALNVAQIVDPIA